MAITLIPVPAAVLKVVCCSWRVRNVWFPGGPLSAFPLGYYLSPREGVVNPGVSGALPAGSMHLIPVGDKVGT